MAKELNPTKQEAVNALLDELSITGEKVSLRGLIERLDGLITSPSTMSDYKSAWQDNRLKKQQAMFDGNFSLEFQQSFMNEITRVTTQVELTTKKHNQELRSDKMELERELERFETLYSEQQQFHESAQHEIAQLKNQLENTENNHQLSLEKISIDHDNQLKQQKTELEHQNETLKAELNATNSSLANQLNDSLEKNNSANITIENLRREIVEMNLRLEGLGSAQEKNEKLENLVEELKNKISNQNALISELKTLLDSADQTRDLVNQQNKLQIDSYEKQLESIKSNLYTQEQLSLQLKDDLLMQKNENKFLLEKLANIQGS